MTVVDTPIGPATSANHTPLFTHWLAIKERELVGHLYLRSPGNARPIVEAISRPLFTVMLTAG